MAKENLNSLDDFQRYVSSTIQPWPPEKRTALAAAMCDRWLPVYDSFAEENEWADPQIWEDAVVAVWNSALGHTLSKKDGQRHYDRVLKDAPHLDDFDCEEVLATAAIITYAIQCAVNPANPEHVVMAMVSAFEGVAPGIYEYPEELPPDVWQLPQVQDELEKQLQLLKLIGDMDRIDKQTIQALREQLASPDIAGTVAPRPEKPKGLTNETIFEQYRQIVESDIKRDSHWETDPSFLKGLENNSGAITTVYLGGWGGRYGRRKDALEEYPMLDVAGHDALLARNAAHDAATQGDPGWDKDTRFWIDLCYQNPHAGFDVNAPEKPHRYGPSLRALCIASHNSNSDVVKSILQWARHRPSSWEEEDRRKKNKLAYATPELGERLSRTVSWRATDDVFHPWSTEVAGETWRIRINDFPDDLMYTLIINDEVIGKFHDWPASWSR